MGDSVKDIIDEMFVLASKTTEVEEVRRRYGEDRIRKIARNEIMKFLMYLSASDGSIEVKEAIFIKDYFEEQISPEEICQRIEDDNLYSVSFEQKAPTVLKYLVQLDNKQSDEFSLNVSSAEKYICLYEKLGNVFIACDHDIAACEREDLGTYIFNMRSYYSANYKGSKEAKEAANKECDKYKVETGKRNQKKSHGVKRETSNDESMDELLEELKSLIGLNEVKAAVEQLIHFNSIRNIRDERGMKQLPITQHMVFYGNPGTGKTTIARLIAKIYHKLGILSKGHLVEVDRSGLVAGYVGHTALKVKDVIKEAKGGVLFIDEAYSLTYRRSESDFGYEAVDTLVKSLEDEREDLVVIVAGYPEPMEEFINSNPGLKSRFNRFINFEDYNAGELFEIYTKMSEEAGYITTEEAAQYIHNWLAKKVEEGSNGKTKIGFNSSVSVKKRGIEMEKDFSNARMVRNFLERIVMNQSDRLYLIEKDELEDSMLQTIECEDVEKVAL